MLVQTSLSAKGVPACFARSQLGMKDHIKQDCTKVTREIQLRVSETVGSRVPDVAPPTAKRQKPTPGKPGHYAALEVPSTSRTTPALRKVLDRKFVRMLVVTGTPFAFANNAFTYDFNKSMRPDYDIPGEHICCFVIQHFTKPLLHWPPKVPNSIKT